MPTTPTSADRAAEFNRLLVEQGHVTRSMKYGWEPDDDDRKAIDARSIRLLELCEMLGAHVNAPGYGGEAITPGRYVNDRIASWLRANPLPLSMERVRSLLTEHPLYALEGGVAVTIGELGSGGYQYRVMADDFAWSGARVEGECSHSPAHETNDADCEHRVVRGDMVLRVPDSVAEHFRQQGRRAIQREFASLMALTALR
jgi:hypothetical protein